jgi:hypothetical protein
MTVRETRLAVITMLKALPLDELGDLTPRKPPAAPPKNPATGHAGHIIHTPCLKRAYLPNFNLTVKMKKDSDERETNFTNQCRLKA